MYVISGMCLLVFRLFESCVISDDGDERRAGNASIPKTKSNDSNSNVGFASRCERKDND